MKRAAANVKLVDDHRGAAAMLGPLRRRILEGLREPDSASGVARRLGLPRQKINYHLRELEKHGLVEHLEERRKGNCTERIVRATARYYLILPEALGELAVDPDAMRDRFSSSYLVAVAARAIQDLGHLRRKAEAAEKRVATLTLETELQFASAQARNAFAEDLSNSLAELIARHHVEQKGSRRFRLFLGMYPALKKEERREQDSQD
jgi:predicted ArsR family transcriptional regulator